MTPDRGPAHTRRDQEGRGSGGPETLESFLLRRGLEVVDVVPSTGHVGRRLLLAAPDTSLVTVAVAVGDNDESLRTIKNEEELLRRLGADVGHDLAGTLPRVLQHVRTGGTSIGLALALPRVPGGHLPQQRTANQGISRDLKAVDAWLELLRSATASGPAQPVEVGSHGVDWLTRSYTGSRHGAGIDVLLRAHRSMAAHALTPSPVHGCLCPRHVSVAGDRVVAVDDWGAGAVHGDPLVDVGGFAVRVAGSGFSEVLEGRTTLARTVRAFVTSGLVRAGLPGRLWREVLLMARVDRAHDLARRTGSAEVDQSPLLDDLTRGSRAAHYLHETRKP